MLLGHIAPTRHLFDIDAKGGLSFALAHIAKRDMVYRSYFKRHAREGRLVLLDNGMWENGGVPLPAEEMIELCREILPTEVYGPDFIYDPDKTMEEVTRFAIKLRQTKLKCCGEPIRVIGCVQGKNLEEWLACYEAMLDSEWVDVIAIPVLELEDFGEDSDPKFRWGLTRLRLVRAIKEKYGFTKTIHLTGIDFPFELAHPDYQHPLVRSHDSKTATVHGKFGIRFDPKGEHWPGKIRSKVYGDGFFDWTISDFEMRSVRHNMRVMSSYVTVREEEKVLA